MNKSKLSPYLFPVVAAIVIAALPIHAASAGDARSAVLVSPDFPLTSAALRAKGLLPPKVQHPVSNQTYHSTFVAGNFVYNIDSRYKPSCGWQTVSLEARYIYNADAPHPALVPRSKLWPNAGPHMGVVPHPSLHSGATRQAAPQKPGPLLIYRLDNGSSRGRSDTDNRLAVGFVNTSAHVITDVSFAFARYRDGVPPAFTSRSWASPIKLDVAQDLMPDTRYRVQAKRHGRSAPPVRPDYSCAKLVGIDITFKGGTIVHADNNQVAKYFAPGVTNNCYALQRPFRDASQAVPDDWSAGLSPATR